MASNLFKQAGDWLAGFVDYVKKTLADEEIRKSIAEDLGLKPGESLQKPANQQLTAVDTYRSKANPDKEAFIILLNDVRALYQNVRNAVSGFGTTDTTRLNAIVYLLFDILAANYARLYTPTLYFAVQALGIIVEDTSALDDDPDAIERFFGAIARAEEFLLSPIGYTYLALKNGVQDGEHAQKFSDRIFPQIAILLILAKKLSPSLESVTTTDVSYGWEGRQDDPSLPRLGIEDLGGLAEKLQVLGDPLAEYLLHKLPLDKQQLLNAYSGSGQPVEELRLALVDTINHLLSDANLYTKERFAKVKLAPETRRTAEQALQDAELIRSNKTLLMEAYPDELSQNEKPLADGISERMLTIAFPLGQNPSATSSLTESIGITLAIVPKTQAEQAGLFVAVNGSGKVEIPLSDKWKVAIEASADPAFSFLLEHDFWDFIPASGPTDLPLNVALVSIPDETDVTYAFPHPDETRIEIGQLAFSFAFDGRNGEIKAQALRCAFVLATKDHDGFLAKVLPSDGLRVPFSFGVGYSSAKHFFKEGGIDWPTGHTGSPSPSSTPQPGSSSGPQPLARTLTPAPDSASSRTATLSATAHPELGFKQVIHIGKALLSVWLDSLLLGLSPSEDPANAEVKIEVSVSLAITLGPVTASVERIGFETGLSFPESGGNAGFADFSLAFKPPSGVGIKVDSPVVSGGGFSFPRSAEWSICGIRTTQRTKPLQSPR